MEKLIKIRVERTVREAVSEAVGGLGGFSAIIRPGDKVLIKPNFNTSDPFPASSDRDFIAAVADLVHEAGAGEVTLGESCTYFLDTRKVMKQWGVDRLTDGRPWLKIVSFDEGRWMRKNIPDGRFLKRVSVPEILDETDRLILLPCLKTHKYAAYTGALKLAVGFVKPNERVGFHMSRLQEKIAELNAVVEPDLIVMDARKCFINRGPSSGDIREPGLVLASRGRVSIDLEGIRIIQGYAGNSLSGTRPEDLPQIKRAAKMGLD